MTKHARRIARRWTLDRVIGRGAHGEVWSAHDALADRDVAVKLVSPSFAAARVRREVAALRLLRLPGVVQLVDEGIDEGAPFVVMELVEGSPFPARETPVKWAEIEDPVLALVDVLSRVHAAGVVHRDLKPSNVLLDREGRPTLLDFGLCDGSLQTGDDDAGLVVGTPAFLAPEQIRGESATAATDLYALGLMLHHALSGVPAHPLDDLVALKRARLTTPAPSLRTRAPEVPSHAAEIIDALLAIEPADRPQSATEVLARLAGGSASPRDVAISTLISRAIDDPSRGLESLFAGPDRVLHLREDAAAALRARIDVADRSAIDREVKAWLRAGLARWDGERLHVDRAAIERIQAMPRASVKGSSRAERRAAHRALAELTPEGDPTRLMHFIAADARDVIADEALRLATTHAERGRLDSAAFVLEEAARALRDEAQLLAVLSLWSEIALVAGAPRGLDRVLYAICAQKAPTERLAQLESLLRAALAVGTFTEQARRLVETIPRFDTPALERRRQAVRVFAAVRSSVAAEASLLEELKTWARDGDDEDRACLSGWLGRLRYRQGRFREAAELHEDAARNGHWITRRIAARINAASAWMEAFELDLAASQAQEGRALAAECRDGFFEGYAERILRAIAVRRDDARGADAELVVIGSKLGGAMEAAVCLTEAAAAFRSHDYGDASRLSSRASKIWLAAGDPSAWLLASSISIATKTVSRSDLVAAVRARVKSVRSSSPSIALQVLALLAIGGHSSTSDAGEVETILENLGDVVRDAPLDVLSIDESLAALRGQSEFVGAPNFRASAKPMK